MHLTLSLLGPFGAKVDKKLVPTSRAKKIEALLIYLAVEMVVPHTRTTLDGLLFPELPDVTARANLRQTLTRLRRAIQDSEASPPFLLITKETIQFNPESHYEIDLLAFQRQVDGCAQHQGQRKGSCTACTISVEVAISSYRGPFLDGFFIDDSVAFERWMQRLREQTHEEVLSACQWLADVYERRGEYALADRYAQRQLDLEPWREEAYQQRMRLLARQGRGNAAVTQYKQCRKALLDELGVEPREETQALLEQIRLATSTRPHNLPQLPNKSFIGREALSGQIHAALTEPEHRLLNLVGPGGIGKTRLALQIGLKVARDYIGPFMHGVYFVTFAGGDRVLPTATDQTSVIACISAITQALSLKLAGPTSPRKQLLDLLSKRECLLILDNCEYLQDNVYILLQDILHSSPQTRILTTSRTRFLVANERVIEVDGLHFPTASIQQKFIGETSSVDEQFIEYPAIQLFGQRAQQADSKFQLDTLSQEEKQAIIHISQLTEGMPLAIELAAVWVRMLTCQQIAQEIEKTIDLLASRGHTHPLRHQSIRAVFTHSWQRLTPMEQRTLASLSVMHGSFDYEAIQQITDAALFVLADLVDKSLLQSIPGTKQNRYALHPLLHQFTAEKLIESQLADYQAKHAHYYGQWIQKQQHDLERASAMTIQEIEDNIENIRAGWHWAIDHHQVELIGCYMNSLYHFYALRGWRYEGRAQFKRALTLREKVGNLEELSNKDTKVFSGLLSRLAGFQYELGRIDETEILMQEGIALSHLVEEEDDLGWSYRRLGHIAHQRGDYGQAIKYFEFSLQIFHEIHADTQIGHILMSLGAIARDQGDYLQAQDFFEQSVAIFRQESHTWGLTHALRLLAGVTYTLSGLAAAEVFHTESLALAKELQSKETEATVLHNWGQIMQNEHHYEVAIELYQSGLRLFQEMEYDRGCAMCLESLGSLMAEIGRVQEGKQYFLEGFRIAITLQDTPLLLQILASIVKFAIQSQKYKLQQNAVTNLLSLLQEHPGCTPLLQSQVMQLQDRLITWDIPLAKPEIEQLSFQEIERVVTTVLVV